MMGPSHRSMGAAWGWTAAVTGDQIWDWSIPVALAVGIALAVLGAEAVMWPDLDHHSSTATFRFGGGLSGDIQDLADLLFCRTATDLDWADPDCRRFRVHRGVTHSLFTGLFLGTLFGALVAGAVWLYGGPWLAVGSLLAVGLGGGMATHGYGDCWTNHGCAFFWPIKIRGRRFYPVRVPRLFRMSTGRGAEPWLVPLIAGVANAAAIIALFPGAWPKLIELAWVLAGGVRQLYDG